VVKSRNATQIQSHAQKYFLRQQQGSKNKRSIHDLTLESPEIKGRMEPSIAHLDANSPAVPQRDQGDSLPIPAMNPRRVIPDNAAHASMKIPGQTDQRPPQSMSFPYGFQSHYFPTPLVTVISLPGSMNTEHVAYGYPVVFPPGYMMSVAPTQSGYIFPAMPGGVQDPNLANLAPLSEGPNQTPLNSLTPRPGRSNLRKQRVGMNQAHGDQDIDPHR